MEMPILDPNALDQLRPFHGHDGGSLLGNLIEIYLEQLPNRLDGLVRAAREGDAPSVFRIAHMLKSTSASLGAYTLQALCQRFEDAGRMEQLDGVVPLLVEFEAQATRVKAALEAEQRKLVP